MYNYITRRQCQNAISVYTPDGSDAAAGRPRITAADDRVSEKPPVIYLTTADGALDAAFTVRTLCSRRHFQRTYGNVRLTIAHTHSNKHTTQQTDNSRVRWEE